MTATPLFLQQTTVTPVDEFDGRYEVVISGDWNAPILPHGGLVTALALRAMQAELNEPEESLRSVTTVFAAQVAPGPVLIDVTVLRRGRSVSQAMATVRNADRSAGHTAMAVFGRERQGFSFTDIAFPDVPGPLDCPSWRDPLPNDVDDSWQKRFSPTFWQQAEGRSALGHAPWDDYDPVSSERAAWYRFDETPRLADGCLDPLALVTLCDTMPGAVSERVGNNAGIWLSPSADLTVHILDDARSDWLLAHNRARHAGGGYASAEIVLWDPAPTPRLVAYGTQMMIFSFPDGPPSA